MKKKSLFKLFCLHNKTLIIKDKLKNTLWKKNFLHIFVHLSVCPITDSKRCHLNIHHYQILYFILKEQFYFYYCNPDPMIQAWNISLLSSTTENLVFVLKESLFFSVQPSKMWLNTDLSKSSWNQIFVIVLITKPYKPSADCFGTIWRVGDLVNAVRLRALFYVHEIETQGRDAVAHSTIDSWWQKYKLL